MAFLRGLRFRFSLAFVVTVQFLQFLNGYSWWMLFSSVGLWSLSFPITSTYGGAALVVLDDQRGIQYTSDWARVFTAGFLALFFTLASVALFAVGILLLGCFEIFL